MARLNGGNWSLNSYVVGEWTTLVDEPGVLASLILSNISAASLNLEMRIYDTVGEVARATILPTSEIPAGFAGVLDARAVVLTGNQVLQTRADAPGLEAFASGGV